MPEKDTSRSSPHPVVQLQNEYDERFLHYFKNNPVPTYAWRKIDAEFILTDYNNAAEKITRGHIADCVGNKAGDFYRDTPDLIDDFNRCFTEKTTFKREMTYWFRTTGEVKRLIIHFIFVPSDLILIHAEDITERALREAELRQSEEKFRTVLENARDIRYQLNLNDGTFDYLSPSAEKITGYTVEELTRGGIAKTRSLIHPEDLRDIDAQSEKLITAMLEGQMDSTIEYRITTKGGDVRWICDSHNLILSPEGVPLAVVGTSRDVTEQRRREEQVRFQANALSHVRDAVIALDTEYRITYWNARAEELYGVQAGNVVGLKLTDVYQYRWLRPEDEQLATDSLNATGTWFGENIHLTKSGEEIFIESSVSVLKDDGGTAIGFLAVMRNITRRKLTEGALKMSEANYHALIETLPLIVYVAKPVPPYSPVYINSGIEALGYSTAEWFATPDLWVSLLHREDRERVLRATEDAMSAGLPTDFEYRMVTREGGVRWFHDKGAFVVNEQGERTAWQGVLIDITERKRTEEALHESEKLYRLIVETANEGIWLIDLDGTIQFINQQAAELLGYTVEEMQGRTAFEFLFDEDQDEAQRRFAKRRDGHRAQAEFRARRKDGSELRILSSSVQVHDKDGAITGLLGMLIDITERKRAEEESARLATEIKTQQERLTSIVATVPGIVWEAWWTGCSLSQRLGFVNDYVETMLGYSVEEWLSKPDFWLSVIHEDDRERAKAESGKIISSEEGGHLEYRMVTKDGRIIWAETQFVIIREEGQPLGLRGVTIDITERKQAEAALKSIEANYRTLVESSPAIVYLCQPEPPYSPIYVSPNISVFGYPREEWFSNPEIWIILIHPEDRERVLRASQAAMHEGLDFEMEYRIITRDGQTRWLHVKGCFIFDPQGSKTAWQGVMLDVTKTKGLEEQLRQSQKLESVGLLAGGIAHDFNNMLTAITGYSELTLRSLKEDNPLRHNIEEIKKAGERSADLTYQLLAFSRQQILQPKILSINRAITDTSRMLGRLIGENIQLVTILNPQAGQVKVDPGQLSQIIMNLAVNARDAMPEGGKLTFETDNVVYGENSPLQHLSALAGEYVMISVSDTGTGMDAETKRHLFEPFFTRKEVGKGTGLGLATVYGIIKQSEGDITVTSEEGVGTTFRVYFPRVGEEPRREEIQNSSEELPGGTETILLVEDEEMVRTLTCRILEDCGYTVIEAHDGVEALALYEEYDRRIDLLLTDVVMPQMGGRELAERLAPLYPHMRILYASGYNDDAVVRHGVIEAGTNFIQKPFTPHGLALKVREILNAPGRT